MQPSQMLTKLRAKLDETRLDGFVIWRGDMFSGEEVRACDERLACVTGFTGSAGFALILKEQAFVFSDGRYHLQLSQQLAADLFAWRDSHPTALADVLAEVFGDQMQEITIGYDATTTTLTSLRKLPQNAGQASLKWQSLDQSLVDAIWQDRPTATQHPAWRLSDDIAGKAATQKIATLQQRLKADHHDGIIISAVDCVNWLFNIRGSDLATTPFHLCFAFVPQQGAPVLMDGISPDYLCESWQSYLAKLPQGRYQIDPMTLPVALFEALQKPKIQISEQPCPLYHEKACKNPVELAGFAKAHLLDGLAVVRFYYWLDHCQNLSEYRETELVAKLQAERAKQPDYLCDSFETIMGSGPNGAVIHYRALKGQDRLIDQDNLLLIDSGGHYKTGTTDITRTFGIGKVSQEAKQAYSAVLSSHIALAMAVFPVGTNGAALDAICRAPLWQTGRDYAHGTGHGVGHILSVHEGPAHISKRAGPALAPGMVLSNEPGSYQAGKWGIRLENLIVIVEKQTGFLGCETLTLVPFERGLIIKEMLSAAAIDWLDAYHKTVYETLCPHLEDAAVSDWLAEKCAPLSAR